MIRRMFISFDGMQPVSHVWALVVLTRPAPETRWMAGALFSDPFSTTVNIPARVVRLDLVSDESRKRTTAS